MEEDRSLDLHLAVWKMDNKQYPSIESDGLTVIKQWVDGEQVQQSGQELLKQPEVVQPEQNLPERNEIPVEEAKPKASAPFPHARGGLIRSPAWKAGAGEQAEKSRSAEAQQARSRARSFLFNIYSGVNTE